MERDWKDFKSLHLNIAGAREAFESACETLIRELYPSRNVKNIDVKVGDHGIDIYVGELGHEPIIVFQCKFFLEVIGDSQKNQIRESFNRAINSKEYDIEKWILCLPKNMDIQETQWWNKWKIKKLKEYSKCDDFIYFKSGNELIDSMKEHKIYDRIFKIEEIELTRDTHSKVSELVKKFNKRNKKGLEQNEREKFIGKLYYKENLIRRYYNKERININFLSNKTDLVLKTILNENNKIILLGNPGIGKTTELQQLAVNIWEDVSDEFIPIYKNLKNFTVNDNIKNYIIDSKLYVKVIYILDGVDEICDIEDFISKLVMYISYLETEQTDFKIILSCRTNVFSSIVKSIPDFELFFLKDLKNEDGIKLLKEKCGDIINNLEIDEVVINFIKNPFQVGILSNYINEVKKLPRSMTELWPSYIKSRLKNDENDKLKKIKLNTSLIEYYSKKVSLINELMNVGSFEHGNLFKILENNPINYVEFIKSPLIERQTDIDHWFFEHKNIQEYFAALLISELDFSEIIEIIGIENTKCSHPSLFNVITFLLNILDDNCQKKIDLIGWFLKNEPDLLFKLEKNSIEKKIRIKVFQDYFKVHCIDTTHWITMDSKYSKNEIASFSNCIENFDYLYGIILDNRFNVRTRISALEIFRLFTIPRERNDELKKDFIEILKSDSDISLKAQIVDSVFILNLCENDFIRKLISTLEPINNVELNLALLTLIKSIGNFDLWMSFIKNQFLLENDISRIYDYKNKWMIFDIILLVDSKKFIELLIFYFDGAHHIEFEAYYEEQILIRASYFIKNENDFLGLFFGSINIKSFSSTESFAVNLVLLSQSEEAVCNILLKKEFSYDIISFLSKISNLNFIELISKKYFDKALPSCFDIDEYRDSFPFNGKWELGYKFHCIMEEKGFVFKKDYISNNNIERVVVENLKKLSDTNSLQIGIKKIFIENNLITINKEIILKVAGEWSRKNGYQLIDAEYSFLKKLTSIYSELDLVEIEKIIREDSIIRYDLIKNILEGRQNIDKIQNQCELEIEKLIEWCLERELDVDFGAISERQKNNLQLPRDYHLLKIIMFFYSTFDINLSKEFLLGCLSHLDISEISTENRIKNIYNNINDKILVDEKIIDNLLNKDLSEIVFSEHVRYALDNNLFKSYETIRKYFLEDISMFNQNEKFEKYIEITDDLELLYLISGNFKNNLYWKALDILRIKGESEFCIKKAHEYLENVAGNHRYEALSILFYFNDPNAIKYYHSYLNEGINIIDKNSCFSAYNNIINYDYIDKIIELIYHEDVDAYLFNGSNHFLEAYVCNLSKDDESYKLIQIKLGQIKAKIITSKNDFDNGLFYISSLIKNSEKTFINSKSKPLNFKGALSKVLKILD